MKLLLLTFLVYFVEEVVGHGRLISPPGRSTMWRYGFNTPKNTNDNQLSCGGFGLQYYSNGGKCGLCGDPWNGLRENEAGGRYATGIIAGHYDQGQIITVQIEVTVNHGGWFEFRLCTNNDPEKKITEDCLNRNLLELTTGGTQYQLSAASGVGIYPIKLKLPDDVTCSQCVLQWKWKTASNVHCQGSTCCRGCGPQEWFYGCADIAINPSSGSSIENLFHLGNQNSQYLPGGKSTQKPLVMSNNFPDSFIPLNVGPSYNANGYIPQNRKSDPKSQS